MLYSVTDVNIKLSKSPRPMDAWLGSLDVGSEVVDAITISEKLHSRQREL